MHASLTAFVPAMWFASPQILRLGPFVRRLRETEQGVKGRQREREKEPGREEGKREGVEKVREAFSSHIKQHPQPFRHQGPVSLVQTIFPANWGHSGDGSGSNASDGR